MGSGCGPDALLPGPLEGSIGEPANPWPDGSKGDDGRDELDLITRPLGGKNTGRKANFRRSASLGIELAMANSPEGVPGTSPAKFRATAK